MWNVKLSAILDSSSSILVLIETLWNVKSTVCGQSGDGVCRINRNIVECKVPCGDMADTGVPVLIETLWNVKFFVPVEQLARHEY